MAVFYMIPHFLGSFKVWSQGSVVIKLVFVPTIIRKIEKLDQAKEAALDLWGQISVDSKLIAMVWGFINGVKRPDWITYTEVTTWSNFWSHKLSFLLFLFYFFNYLLLFKWAISLFWFRTDSRWRAFFILPWNSLFDIILFSLHAIFQTFQFISSLVQFLL